MQKSAPPIDGMWTRKPGDLDARRQTGPSAVSVTATVLNEVDDIDRLVAGLMQQTLRPAEVVIVDGGSTDGTWERLQAAGLRYPNLIAIRDESCSLKASPGPIGRGRNTAVARASSDDHCLRRCRMQLRAAVAGSSSPAPFSATKPNTPLEGLASIPKTEQPGTSRRRRSSVSSSARMSQPNLALAAPWPFANSYGSK